MIDIGQDLVIGVGMHGRHQAGHYTKLLMQGLDQRCQAVGRAGSVGNNGVFFFQHALVDAKHDGGIDILAAGSGDDDFFRATLQVCRCLFLGSEKAGALKHHVHTKLAPGQFGGIAVGQHADFVTIDHHVIALNAHGAGELAVRRVVLGEVGVGLGIAQVIDGHDLNIVLFATFVMGTQDVAADAAVAVNSNANRHDINLLVYKTCLTASATFSAVRPKCLNNTPAGADSP